MSLDGKFGLKRPFGYISNVCYMQAADISEIVTPPSSISKPKLDIISSVRKMS